MKNWRKTVSLKSPVKSRVWRLLEEYRDYDKSAFYLPRHHVMTFSPCAELWRIMGIFCGNACPFFKIQTTVWLRMPKDRKNSVELQPWAQSIRIWVPGLIWFIDKCRWFSPEIFCRSELRYSCNSSWLSGRCTGIYDDPWGVLFCRRIKQWKMKNSHLRCEGGSK